MSAGFYQGDNNFLNKFLNDVDKSYIKLGKSGLPVPYEIAGDMVSMLPNSWFNADKYINNDIFDKDSYVDSHRVIDICCNSGAILERFYYSFMSSLARVIPDSVEREDYIFKNLLYAFCLDEQIARLLRMRFYWSFRCKGHVYQYNIIENTGIDLERARSVLKSMRFDVVCGNPPYNNDMYLDFVMKGHELSKSYDLWITPAKWQAKGGKLNDFMREDILPLVQNIDYYSDTKGVFPKVALDGGIAYYLVTKNKCSCRVRNKDINNCVIDEIISNRVKVFDIRLQNILEKLESVNSNTIFDSKLLTPVKSYFCGLETADPHLVTDDSSMYRLVNQKYNIGVPKDKCSNIDDIDSYKIYATHYMNDSTNYFKLNPYEFSTRGNILLYFGTSEECDSALSYYTSSLIRYLSISTGLGSVCKECFKFVPDPVSFDKIYEDKPIMGYTPDENGEYIDADGNKHCSLYVKYKLTDEEIDIIESVIRKRK